MDMSPKAYVWDSIQLLALDVYKLMRGEVAVAINFLDEDTSYYPVLYLPDPCSSQPKNVAVDDKELVTSPRTATLCQHVIHQARPVEFAGMENAPSSLTLSEFQLISRIDPTVASKMEENANNGLVCDKDNNCPFMSIWWDLQVNATSTVWYRGTPIFCNGERRLLLLHQK